MEQSVEKAHNLNGGIN